MRALHRWPTLPAFAVAVMLATSAAAQQSDQRSGPETYAKFAASVSAGLKVPYDTPDASVRRVITAASVALTPRLRIEGEWFAPGSVQTTQVYRDDRLGVPYVLNGQVAQSDRMQGGGVLLTFEFGSGRLRPFIGGGVLFERHRVDDRFLTTCEPRVAGGCDGVEAPDLSFGSAHIDVRPQGAAGVNIGLAPRLFGFGAVRIDDGLTVHGGARVVIVRRAVPPPVVPAVARGSVDPTREQPEVRVVFRSGLESRGRLVSLSTTSLELRDRQGTASVALADVQRIERVTHRVRNSVLIGLAAGYVIGYFGSCGSGDEEDCWPEIGLLVAGGGAGAGALIGMIMNRNAAHDGRDVIYLAPARAGLQVGWRWSF